MLQTDDYLDLQHHKTDVNFLLPQDECVQINTGWAGTGRQLSC